MFSTWLEKSRRRLSLSQRELAAAVGMSPGAVGLWEQGRRLPGPRAAARLEEFFRGRGMEMPPLPPRPEPPEKERLRRELRQSLRR